MNWESSQALWLLATKYSMPHWNKDATHVVTEQFFQRVILEQRQEQSVGSRGEGVYVWNIVNSALPAAVCPLTGRELELARQILPNASHKITIRYLAGVSVVTWRVVFDSQHYYIGHVQNVEQRDRVLVLTCTTESSEA